MEQRIIEPAKLLSTKLHLLSGQLIVGELFFEVPLEYPLPDSKKSNDKTLRLFARCVTKYERPAKAPRSEDPLKKSFSEHFDKPWVVYLEGGPGFGCREPQSHPLTKSALSRGYQVLYPDYRGTGLSSIIDAQHVKSLGGPQEQAEYLKLFCADNNVRDLEAMRLCLTSLPAPASDASKEKTSKKEEDKEPEETKQWSILGQSYGGFTALTYLSLAPHGLREVFTTGGLATLTGDADRVYQRTFKKLTERNEAYWRKYPEDVDTQHQIAVWLDKQGGSIALPTGGRLDMRRVLMMGHAFGFQDGLDDVHGIMLKMKNDLDIFGHLTYSTLAAAAHSVPFDFGPLYAIHQESLYCTKPGIASNWAAQRVGAALPGFSWVDDSAHSKIPTDRASYPLNFSGEMVYPWMIALFPELEPLSEAIEILAQCDTWPASYDEEVLSKNEVPFYALNFLDDMYVDYELAMETAGKVKGIRCANTNMMDHSALRTCPDEAFAILFKLRDDYVE